MSHSQSHRTHGILVLATEITVALVGRQKLCKVGCCPQRFHIITASKTFTYTLWQWKSLCIPGLCRAGGLDTVGFSFALVYGKISTEL